MAETCHSRKEAVAILKKVMVLPSSLDYVILLLFVAHTYMRDVLPKSVCLYLAFDGDKSAGKSTITKETVYLCCNGKMLESTTAAALKRQCDEHRTLGIDEVDKLAKSNDSIETILRVGSSWSAKATLCDREDKGGKIRVVEADIGGPKVFNFRGEVDDALRSRCYVIGLRMTMDTGIILDAMFSESILEPVRRWIEYEATERLREVWDDDGGWSPERVEGIMRSDEFKERLSRIKPALARNLQQAAIMLIVSQIMSWNLDKDIKEAVELQLNEDLYEADKAIILEYYIKNRPEEVIVSDLRAHLNQERLNKKLKQITNDEWGGLQRECGWQDGVNKYKDRARGGKHYLKFDETVLRCLGVDSSGPSGPSGPNPKLVPGEKSDQRDQTDQTIRKYEDKTEFLFQEIEARHPTREALEVSWPDLKLHLDELVKRGWVGIQANQELFVQRRG